MLHWHRPGIRFRHQTFPPTSLLAFPFLLPAPSPPPAAPRPSAPLDTNSDFGLCFCFGSRSARRLRSRAGGWSRSRARGAALAREEQELQCSLRDEGFDLRQTLNLKANLKPLGVPDPPESSRTGRQHRPRTSWTLAGGRGGGEQACRKRAAGCSARLADTSAEVSRLHAILPAWESGRHPGTKGSRRLRVPAR